MESELVKWFLGILCTGCVGLSTACVYLFKCYKREAEERLKDQMEFQRVIRGLYETKGE